MLILVVSVLGPALMIRACRPGPIPRHRDTWFDVIGRAR